MSSITPRSFADLTGSRSFPKRERRKSFTLAVNYLLPNMTSFVLSGLNKTQIPNPLQVQVHPGQLFLFFLELKGHYTVHVLQSFFLDLAGKPRASFLRTSHFTSQICTADLIWSTRPSLRFHQFKGTTTFEVEMLRAIVPGSLALLFNIDLISGHANMFLVQTVWQVLVTNLL